MRRSSTLADYFVLATVDSGPQSSAVAKEIELQVKALSGGRALRSDGGDRAAWRVLDFGGLVVHLMTEPVRAFYGLERLWELARPIPWAVATTLRVSRSRKPRP